MQTKPSHKLLFVYNTKLNVASLFDDFLSEVLPQRQANCVLCDITYSLAWKKRSWSDYLCQLNIPHSFYFKDAFAKEFSSHELPINFPSILILDEERNSLKEIISSNQINQLKTIEELILLLDKKME